MSHYFTISLHTHSHSIKATSDRHMRIVMCYNNSFVYFQFGHVRLKKIAMKNSCLTYVMFENENVIREKKIHYDLKAVTLELCM